ncbi:hypothetical protein NBRC10512_006293 [Rhodotorula toruloides]
MSRRGTASLFVPDDLLERALRASEEELRRKCKGLFAVGRREEGVTVVADLLEAEDVDTAQAELRRRGAAGTQQGLETVGEIAHNRCTESDGARRTPNLRLRLLRGQESPVDDETLSPSPFVILYARLRHLEALAVGPLPLNFHPASFGRPDVEGDQISSTHGATLKQASPTIAIGIHLINVLHQDSHTFLGKTDSSPTVPAA